MASNTVTVPDFQFAFFYPQILESLLTFKRINAPELTDESEFEPSIQLLRSFAVVGHYTNAVIDMAANEALLRTSALQQSVRDHLRLIDYEMSPARPSQTELLYELSRVFTTTATIVPDGAQASTEEDPDTGIKIFVEANEALSITDADGTSKFSSVLAEENGVFTDFTTEANDPTTPATDWTPWASPANNDAVYFGHVDAMHNRIDLFFTTENPDNVGIWEFYNGDFQKAKPDSVAVLGNKLQVFVNGYLGDENRAGTLVRITLVETGASEDAEVVWTGSQNIVETTTLLGQSAVSTDSDDYIVGSDWDQITLDDETTGVFGTTGAISFTVPQSDTQNWKKTTIEGVEAFWIRFRIIDPDASSPVVQYGLMTQGAQYMIGDVTQGQTQIDSPLGSSDGSANQTFLTSRENFIDDSTAVLTVNATAWTRVRDFINSTPLDEHYVVQLTGTDQAQIIFGNGDQGRIPPVGASNIAYTFRFGAENDGNVGANRITLDNAGLSFVNSITNPRQAAGWSASEGADACSLEITKQTGPATLRSKDVAISADDLPNLTTRFVDDNGAQPYSRAFAIEEAFGPKTVELVVVAKGGGAATTTQLEELELFFNGDKFARPQVVAHFVSNQKVTAKNYIQKPIDIRVEIQATGVIRLQIENQLRRVFQPEARTNDGLSFEWDFGETVALSRIDHEIHKVSTSIQNVNIIEPATDVGLSGRQLPIAGNIQIEFV